MKLVFLRHGLTDWNIEKRIQGQIDKSLSDLGIEQIKSRSLPEALRQLPWYCSPMLRARQTAALLDIEETILEPALREMHWGDWEGQILKPLRKQLGESMRLNEASGLDFCPPNGESPRQLQQRLKAWLREVASTQQDCAAVVHKGVIRACYSMAFDWDMCGELPVKFDWRHAHEFELEADGRLARHLRSIALIERT